MTWVQRVSGKAREELIEEWVERYRAGETLKSIAKDSGYSTSGVRKILKFERGIKLRGHAEHFIKNK